MFIRIGSDLEIEKTDYSLPDKFGWKEFYGFRNHVIRVLSRFGTVGPTGEADLSAEDDDAPEFKGEVVLDPDFFVVDDMFNNHDQLSIVECDVKLVHTDLIRSIVEMASAFPGWRVVMNLGDSGLRILGDRVLVGGRRFWDCKTIDELGARCGKPVEFGLPPFVESMYALWVDVVCGEFDASNSYATPPNREWLDSIHTLQHMSRSGSAALGPNAYDRIRYDLHPLTRREFAARLLSELSSIPVARLRGAKRNLRLEAADGLKVGSSDERRRFAGLISEGQRTAASALDVTDVVFWWPYIIDAINEPPKSLRPTLEVAERWQSMDSTLWRVWAGTAPRGRHR